MPDYRGRYMPVSYKTAKKAAYVRKGRKQVEIKNKKAGKSNYG